MEDQSLTRAEADPEVPVLPGDRIAVDLEAWPVRLSDDQRLQVGAGVAALPEMVVLTGRMPVSTKSTTLNWFMSAVTTTPSIGRS
jgi:hypothetical protein